MNNLGICTRLLPGAANGARFLADVGHHEDAQRKLKSDYRDAINGLAAREVDPAEYTIRGMNLCNGRRDYYNSRFSRSALQEVAELLPGAPVMRSHNYDGLPVGTFIEGKVVKQDGVDTVQALYYMPNDDEGSRLRTRIDLGIQREVSIGWRCMGAQCSVCNEHIYACPHIPGDIYRGKGICEFEFSGITNVLEGSMVFRGGQKGTSTFIPAGHGVAGEASRSADDGDMWWREIAPMKRDARAAGLGLMFAQPGERGNTQALVFPRSRFADLATAKRWARENDFRADHSAVNEADIVLEQFKAPDGAEFDDIRIEDGIRARVVNVTSAERGRSFEEDFNALAGAHANK